MSTVSSNGTGRRPINAATIVAIIAVSCSAVLGGVTIWQTSQSSGRADRQQILNKIEDVKEKVMQISIDVATLSQRLEDHIGVHP